MSCWTGRKAGASLASERREGSQKVNLPGAQATRQGRRAHGRVAR